MSHLLPPKRWQEDGPQFDGLRHKLWYNRLLKRKKHIPMLKLAAAAYQAEDGLSMDEACVEFGVDSRELRDWIAFHDQMAAFEPLGPKDQAVMNAAYAIYCDSNADYSFRHCIEKSANYYSVAKRPLVEAWEVNPTVYPTGLKRPT